VIAAPEPHMHPWRNHQHLQRQALVAYRYLFYNFKTPENLSILRLSLFVHFDER
jgi:hypothetical protein